MQIKRLLLFLFAVCLCSATISPTSMPDISGDGAAHQIASSGAAAAILFVCKSGNASTVLIGDSTITTGPPAIGIPCAAGGTVFLPSFPLAGTEDRRYKLSDWYYLIQSGDKLSITRFNQ